MKISWMQYLKFKQRRKLIWTTMLNFIVSHLYSIGIESTSHPAFALIYHWGIAGMIDCCVVLKSVLIWTWIQVTWEAFWYMCTFIFSLVCHLSYQIKYIWYDIYLLIAVGLTPSSSSTVHIYTQAVHRTTQTEHPAQNIWTIRIHKCNNKNT